MKKHRITRNFVRMPNDNEATMDITVGDKGASGIPLRRNYRTNGDMEL